MKPSSQELCHRRKTCRLCGGARLTTVLELAPTPPANATVLTEMQNNNADWMFEQPPPGRLNEIHDPDMLERVVPGETREERDVRMVIKYVQMLDEGRPPGAEASAPRLEEELRCLLAAGWPAVSTPED